MKPSRAAALTLRLAGWQWEGALPAEKKFVCLAYPHTSNWDGVVLLLVARTVGLDMRFMIKSEWTRGPLGPLMRGFGAVAVDRSKKNNIVDDMIAEFGRCESMQLVIPPEGTRGRTDGWRSGFYYIARGANVPVVPGYLDFRRKRAGMGPPVYLTGDVKADMDKLRAFYAQQKVTPHNPADVGAIRLREEAEA